MIRWNRKRERKGNEGVREWERGYRLNVVLALKNNKGDSKMRNY